MTTTRQTLELQLTTARRRAVSLPAEVGNVNRIVRAIEQHDLENPKPIRVPKPAPTRTIVPQWW